MRSDPAIQVRLCLSRADDLTDGTARQILVHNDTGAELCGWK